ncbi:ribosomal L1 domain-containing protein CG13096 [Cephus cinctus]|uniref:Ribosomal L1 domain-containing protein CG13096 n=1 Tax=Cephus cinctus TaxID=211228 RepID=A0AAJ7CG00_CEPCN|nr:ribosomal L1 domain-containing protein CG13096 [Cephus cinctus]XP_015609942.1 ribosomal L1 domain-containing protein CG13096 [Cephus cinctus]
MEPRVLRKKKINKIIKNVKDIKSPKDHEEEVKKVAIRKPVAAKKKKKLQIEEDVAEPVVAHNEDVGDITQLKLDKKQIHDAIKAVFALVKKRAVESATLFKADHEPIFMQINCIRIPQVATRQLRILLPHKLITNMDDVALFVKDLERGRKRDFETTINHYKDMLDEHGCKTILTVIPMLQLKTEFRQFEMRRKLLSMYDYFLTDGRIAGHVAKLLGRKFSTKGKLPTSIRIDSKNLMDEIDYALRKTSMQLHSLGNMHIVKVGHTEMTKKQVFENILAVCKKLAKSYPGGWDNIRSLSIKTGRSLAIPIYVTLKSISQVEVPVVPSKRPKAYKPITGELTTFTGKVAVTLEPDGDITVKRKHSSLEKTLEKSEDANENDVITKKKIKK